MWLAKEIIYANENLSNKLNTGYVVKIIRFLVHFETDGDWFLKRKQKTNEMKDHYLLLFSF